MDVAAEEGNEEGRKEGRQVTIITNEREIVMWPEFGAMQRHYNDLESGSEANTKLLT